MILYGYRGSIAHNLYIPPDEEMGTDDIDMMGITISPKSYYLGLDRFDGIEKKEGECDIVIYDIKKFFRLLLKGNPNVLSFLYNERKMFQIITKHGQAILDNRNFFLGKNCFNAFYGYAKSQFQKMERQTYQGYMGAKRKELFDKYGYDTKNATHLIRLLRMGIELLNTGSMTVYRTCDREELIEIKQGKIKLSQIITMSKKLFGELHVALEKSSLPSKPDYQFINNLLVKILEDFHFGKFKQ